MRQHAYCLVFGISPSDIKDKSMKEYSMLLHKSGQRVERHNNDPKVCKCNTAPDCGAHKVGQSDHLCHTIIQIKKDVPRTTSIFQTQEQKQIGDIPISSGENPIYNMLVAYSELDP